MPNSLSPGDEGWDTRWCGHTTSGGTSCRAWRTRHVDGTLRDRCHFHGGDPRLSQAKAGTIYNGRYSYAIRSEISAKLNRAGQTLQALDIGEELALFRAYLTRGLEEWQKNPDGFSMEEASWVFDKLERVSKLVETIVKLRNETALTVVEVHMLQLGMAKVLKKYVPNDQLRLAIEDLMILTRGSDSEKEKMAPNDLVIDGAIVSGP